MHSGSISGTILPPDMEFSGGPSSSLNTSKFQTTVKNMDVFGILIYRG